MALNAVLGGLAFSALGSLFGRRRKAPPPDPMAEMSRQVFMQAMPMFKETIGTFRTREAENYGRFLRGLEDYAGAVRGLASGLGYTGSGFGSAVALPQVTEALRGVDMQVTQRLRQLAQMGASPQELAAAEAAMRERGYMAAMDIAQRADIERRQAVAQAYGGLLQGSRYDIGALPALASAISAFVGMGGQGQQLALEQERMKREEEMRRAQMLSSIFASIGSGLFGR